MQLYSAQCTPGPVLTFVYMLDLCVCASRPILLTLLTGVIVTTYVDILVNALH